MKLCLSMFAAALLFTASSRPAAAEGGWYLAADAGQSHFSGGVFDGDPFPSTWTRSASDSSTGYRLTGGYQFTPNWGVEAGYLDLGHGTLSGKSPVPASMPDVGSFASFRIGAKGVFAAGTGTWPIDDQWSLFARAGLVDGRLDDQPYSNGNIASLEQTETSWKATYGVGAKWAFQPQWSLRLGWDGYRQLGGQYDLSLISLGVEWRFF
ncbi:MAG TPA: porin family protein [Gammaproteobacteria bacterium]|jgi:OOP family OmpA-OmpF porin